MEYLLFFEWRSLCFGEYSLFIVCLVKISIEYKLDCCFYVAFIWSE